MTDGVLIFGKSLRVSVSDLGHNRVGDDVASARNEFDFGMGQEIGQRG